MMLVGFLGCYGAIQESQCLLGTVSIVNNIWTPEFMILQEVSVKVSCSCPVEQLCINNDPKEKENPSRKKKNCLQPPAVVLSFGFLLEQMLFWSSVMFGVREERNGWFQGGANTEKGLSPTP